MFDALGLSTICGEARPEAVPHSASRASGIRMLTGVATGAVVVDGTKGGDQRQQPHVAYSSHSELHTARRACMFV